MDIQLYHVTLTINIQSIYTHGLLPDMATGKEKKVWLVTREALLWAIAHCANRHDVHISDLVVIPIYANIGWVFQTKWQGVYSCPTLLHANTHPRTASRFIDELGLTAYETSLP